jgi:hypothetical protein
MLRADQHPMPRPKRDFEREEAELRAELEGSKVIDLVADGLSQLEEDWARALVKARPAGRVSHIAAMRAAAKRGIEPSLALEASKHMAKSRRVAGARKYGRDKRW